MKRCGAKPYEGADKYIFISYCHKDKAVVFPVVERLAKDGYRVWYDEGIDPGSEWPEIIAEHLSKCSVCIAFISENSLNSHNCRREINFALLKKKSFISVVIEQVNMSPGMEMQLSATQSIFKHTLNSDAEFFERLCTAEFLKCCLGTPDPSIQVSHYQDYQDEDGKLFSESGHQRDTFSDKWFVQDSVNSEKSSEPVKDTHQTAETDTSDNSEHISDEKHIDLEPTEPIVPKIQNEPVVSQIQSAPVSGLNETPELNKPHTDPQNTEPKGQGINGYNISNQAEGKAWITRVKTGEKITVSTREFRLGRSNTKCDYAVLGNGAVGRFHAVIVFCDNAYYLIDKTSTNKTYLNSRELVPEERYRISNNDEFRLANEPFTFHLEK